MKKVSCVYCVTCLKNNRKYIGFTTNYKRRIIDHKYTLNKNKVGLKDFQNDWNIYGESNFLFEVIEYTNNRKREEFWSKSFRKKFNLYNIKDGDDWRGKKPKGILKHTEETKKIISVKNSGENNGRNTMNLDKALKIKSSIIKLRNKNFIWKDIEKKLAKKYNTSPRMIERIRYGDHYLSHKIGGSYKNWREDRNEF